MFLANAAIDHPWAGLIGLAVIFGLIGIAYFIRWVLSFRIFGFFHRHRQQP